LVLKLLPSISNDCSAVAVLHSLSHFRTCYITHLTSAVVWRQ
jgi:hypothetical protein